jgi:outer membrane protein assembly factor BamB
MLYQRRAFLVVLVAGLVALAPVLLAPPAAAQKKGPFDPQQPQPDPKVDFKAGTLHGAIKLQESKEHQEAIDAATDEIVRGDYEAACRFIQEVLNSQEDAYVSVDIRVPGQAPKTKFISARIQANNLITSMPPEGQRYYENAFGTTAKQKLDDAKKTGNKDLIDEVVTKYRNTKAGQEAYELQATYFLDRRAYDKAALQFADILGKDMSGVNDLVLFKATLAFKLNGDVDRAEAATKALIRRVSDNGGLALANGQMASVQQVKDFLKNATKSLPVNINDWPYVNGNLPRNAQARGSPPMLDTVLWTRSIIGSDDPDDIRPGNDAKPFLLRAIEDNLKSETIPVMPGGFPVAANGMLIFRTYDGVAAVFVNDKVDKDGAVDKAGSIAFRSMAFDGSLAQSMSVGQIRSTLTGWLDGVYSKSGLMNILYENSTVGTLTTDGRYVYAVDDLAIPIPPKYLMQSPVNFWGNAAFVNDAVKPLVKNNMLWAFDTVSGRIVWKLGSTKPEEKSEEYNESHFICTPISVGGKLYVLNEKNSGDLRLLCLDPNDKGKQIGKAQPLGTVKSDHRYYHDPARRINAIHLAYAEGILVCPTNAGEIMGIDLLSRTLAWAYPYREKPADPMAFPGQGFVQQPQGPIKLSYSNWKVSPPVIVDGKVVFTAPDSNSVHCINLRDGSQVWMAPQWDTDLFLAGVFGEKVVIVGKNSVRAIRLSDGVPYWNSLPTGSLPSGQGVASNDIYYLPLAKGEILAVDLDKWTIKAHNRAANSKAPVPGNLVFYDGVVLSQTPTAIVAYPQLATKLKEATDAFAKNATPENQLIRGELRLADGQVQGAVDDLQAVLGKEPADSKLVPRAKNRLYEALTDLLTSDFDNASKKYLDEYKGLCDSTDAAIKEQRRTRFLRILAQGREGQGNLVEAFLAYKDYGNSPMFKDDGIPSIDDPTYKIPTNLWLRGRITAMFEKANAQQRAALESKIADEWNAVKKNDDPIAIRQFTGMFDVPFAVGREARLELANVIIEKKRPEDFLEAELNLQQLRVPAFRKDPAVGGKALEALARLEQVKGTEEAMRLAASYYRELKAEFGKAVIASGKTGDELYSTVAESPLLRPFLEDRQIDWGNAKIGYKHFNQDTVKPVQGFVFQPAGDLTPLMEQQRLVLFPQQQNNPTLSLVDMSTGQARWSTPLGQSQTNSFFVTYLYNQANSPMGFYPDAQWRFFHVKGHVAVLQVGMTAYGVDLDNGKVLWHHQLFDPAKVPQSFNWQVTHDDKGRLWAMYQTQFGQQVKVRIGQVGSVQATYAALITQKGLVVVDPINGKTLWTKPGLSSNTEIFGDDQNIYYVELAEGTAVGAGRCLRASDGAHVDVPDFGHAYRHQQRIIGGRYILTAEPEGQSLTMRLVDARNSKDKDAWKRTFENDPIALKTEDWYYCGVIERATGKVIVVDIRDGKEVLNGNVLQVRITKEDLKELENPLFLDDGKQFYVALNQKSSGGKVLANTVSNNFHSGTRCLPVNGWFLAFDRKGGFEWYALDRIMHQMIVVEQFRAQPALLFTSRYMEVRPPNQQFTYFTETVSISKRDGTAIRWIDPRASNGQSHYIAFSMDLRAGSVSLVGLNHVDQWFVEK